MRNLFFDDLSIGQRFESRGQTITERAIVEFGRAYDQQPYHIDAVAAAKSDYGGIIAPGFLTVVVSMALFFDMNLFGGNNLGSPGVEKIRWLRPVRPDDTLRVTLEILRLQPSQSKPDRGVVWVRHDTQNQRRETVMTAEVMHMIRRRAAADGAGAAS